jgi:phospholipid/cholesterol/gamma-HCH transport system substrate-binding protein
MVEISRATGGEVIKPGERIPAKEPGNLMRRIDRMAGKAEMALGGVSQLTSELSNEDLHRDLRNGVREFGVLLKHLNEGRGYPHRFINDPAEADRISTTVSNIDRAALELTYTLREIRMLAAQIRSGPGFAHDMLLGDGPKAQIEQFGNAAGELATTLKAIRQGDGFAKSVLFGGDPKTGDALSNVTQITADVRDIVQSVKRGGGTLGALLVDPSVYEDVKRLLGNIERNILLRAVVRHSIKQGDPAKIDGAATPAVPKASP